MKKIHVTIVSVLAVVIMMITGCKSFERCPAYGKSPKSDAVKHS